MIDSTDFGAVERAVFEVVSDRTGYPVDALDLDVSLDADLGIDADTWQEILRALHSLFPHLATGTNGRSGTIRDLIVWCFTGSVRERTNNERSGDPATTPDDPEGIERPLNTRLLDAIPVHIVTRRQERTDPFAGPTDASTSARNTTAPGEALKAPESEKRSDSDGGIRPLLRLVGVGDEFRDREWSFDAPFRVGRGRVSGGLVLDAPSATSVSRLHAAVSHDESGWWITDLGSTNGTFLNGTRMGTEPAGPLQAGDVIQFSTIAVQVDFATEPVTQRAEHAEGTGNNGGWARSVPAQALLTAIGSSNREHALVLCGCARRFSHLFRPEHFDTIDRAERIVDGADLTDWPEANGAEPLAELVSALARLFVGDAEANRRLQSGSLFPRWPAAAEITEQYLGRLLVLAGDEPTERAAEAAAQGVIVRDVFGDPPRTAAFDARWRTADVVGLARCMYDQNDFTAMPILADALQDAECNADDVLEHCRANTPHVRGCWVVDAVLGRRSEEDQLRTFGMLDPLTGVWNGRWFGMLFELGKVRSLLEVEIDHFARFNNTNAHASGNRVLVEIAILLRDTLGARGLLARKSGHGFTIVLDTSLSAALAVGERLRRVVEGWRGTNEEEPTGVGLTISIGVASTDTIADTGRTHQRLKFDAQQALLDAKATGGNRVRTR